MATERSTSTTPQPSKSKQERIRDNQRRSRARRQEYLADLERRLKECHVTCREAELQRTAFADLQAENTRLRDLLNYAGISPDVVEGFGRQSTLSQAVHATDGAFRQIKPKFQTPLAAGNADTMIKMKQESTSGSCCSTTSPSSSLCATSSALHTNPSGVYGGQQAAPFVASPAKDTMVLSATAGISPTSTYKWMVGSDSKTSTVPTGVFFFCDTFRVAPGGPLLVDNGNTVQCSVAKAIIDQYNPTPTEMDEIRARLATAFSPRDILNRDVE